MNLLGKKVQHKKLGTGEIIEINGNIISVAFSEKVSKFQYPKAFELFIQAIDIDVREFIASDLKKLISHVGKDSKRIYIDNSILDRYYQKGDSYKCFPIFIIHGFLGTHEAI